MGARAVKSINWLQKWDGGKWGNPKQESSRKGSCVLFTVIPPFEAHQVRNKLLEPPKPELQPKARLSAKLGAASAVEYKLDLP